MTIKDIVLEVDWKSVSLIIFCIITILSACICLYFSSLSKDMKEKKVDKVSFFLFMITIIKTICVGSVAFYWKETMIRGMALWKILTMLILMILSLLEWFLLVMLTEESKKQKYFIRIETILISISILVLGLVFFKV